MMKHNGQAVKKTIAVAFTVGTISLLGAGTASATHTHYMKTGNGSCVLLAQNGGEDLVVLPFVGDDGADGTRSHPLHVLVHKGVPGRDGHITIGVAGDTDPCHGDYLND